MFGTAYINIISNICKWLCDRRLYRPIDCGTGTPASVPVPFTFQNLTSNGGNHVFYHP